MFFLFNDTSPTKIYTLSLHDALPILPTDDTENPAFLNSSTAIFMLAGAAQNLRRLSSFTSTVVSSRDRKSTRLNSSHVSISYAVFCLKKKKKKYKQTRYSI